MTYLISKEIEFDAGHRVPLHESKCKNPHGHRYRLKVEIIGELITEGPESGMVRDFSIVKQLMMERIHDVYDHSFIISNTDREMIDAFEAVGADWKIHIVDFVPTAECLAKHFYDLLKDDLEIVQIQLWETPTSCATFVPDKGDMDPLW